jgi:RND family efflux transporter MFP subunit
MVNLSSSRSLALVGLGLGMTFAQLDGGVQLPGMTEPFFDSLLSAEASGRIATIHHPEGSFVEQGELLVILDSRMEELELQRRQLISESTVELELVETQLAVLQENLEATKRLFDTTGSVSREQLSKIELDHQVALAEKKRILEAKERERIEYKMAREQLARRQVRAPFSGVITEVFLDPGEACEPRQPVLRLVDLERVYFVANAKPEHLSDLEVGMEVSLAIGEESSVTEVMGKVEYITPMIDSASGLQRLKVLFENPEGKVTPGTLGRLRVPEN